MKKIKLFFTTIMVLLSVGIASAQTMTVNGTVTDADSGDAIPFASVSVKGTMNGVSSDADGYYSIKAGANAVLVFSYVGYTTVEVPVGAKAVIDVMLKPSVEAIDETIVVAFGTSTKEAFTGSAKVLKSDEISKTQTTSVANALVGKTAGVQFSSASGRLGAEPSINIRGFGSINAGNSPLWVVDGAPYEGDVNNINTSDIESVTVLKDAASNALYGARGANGVIMVTTKRAKAGEAKVSFDGKWGVNTKALQNYDIIGSAGEFYEMHYKSLYNFYTLDQGMDATSAYMAANSLLTSTDAGGLGYNVYTVPEGMNLIGQNGKINPYATLGRVITGPDGNDYYLQPDNWLDEIYKSSFRHEYNVNVAGANDKSNYYASMGYLDNNGIIDGSSMSRFTARLRADYQAKKWLKVGMNTAYTHFKWLNGNDSDNEGASDGGNAFAVAIRMAPIYPVYIRDGKGNIMIDKYGMKLYDTGDGKNGGALRTNGGQSNELQDIQLNKYKSEGNAFTGNAFVDFTPIKGLKININGSVNLDETRSTQVMNPYYGQFAESGGLVSKSHSRDISYNFQQLISYNHKFNGGHTMDLLAGHEMYKRMVYGLSANRKVMFSPDNDELSGAVVDGASSRSSMNQYNNEGYFLRGQYDYMNRVFFSASYRRDASSRFHPKHRWGNFWSVGAAWLVSEEPWFNSTWVNMLKVKASYGSQGNDNIFDGGYVNDYLYTDYYSIESDGGTGITTVFSRKGNENITWETNGNLNIGLEFGLWNDVMTGNVDFFHRKTSDMLFRLSVPKEAGYSYYFTNIGDMSNTGVELELDFNIIRTRNVYWGINLNMTHYKNKVDKLPEEYTTNVTADGKTKGYWSGGSYFISEGMPYHTFYIPTYAGVEKDTGKSMWYTYNENGERVTTTDYSAASQNGRELHGCATPDLYGGFGTSLTLYGVDLSANFTYQIGGKVIDSGYRFYMSSPQGTSTGDNKHRDLLKGWSADNKDSDIPRLAYGDTYSNAMSNRFLTDASYLNIQNITLGYTLPAKITRKFLVEKLRIYFTCDNVWYWSRRQGLDPRQSISGTTNPFYYAPIRTFSGGLSLTF